MILYRTGLFEPVGTHKNHRRRGFGRAILLYGMQQMAATGKEFALVAHSDSNKAASGLYQACGFKPWHMQDSGIYAVQWVCCLVRMELAQTRGVTN